MALGIKFYYKVLGGHTHVRVFSGPLEGTCGKAGELILRNGEWEVLREVLHTSSRTPILEEVPDGTNG